MRWALALAVFWLLQGCAPPRQYSGLIHIDHGGFHERLDALCELGVGPGAALETCAAP